MNKQLLARGEGAVTELTLRWLYSAFFDPVGCDAVNVSRCAVVQYLEATCRGGCLIG